MAAMTERGAVSMTSINVGLSDSSGPDSDGRQVNDIRNIIDINGTYNSFI